jgi:Mn-dependent DtxR family transcriptional regulator
MGNAPSSVYNMLKKLAKQELIDWEPKQKEILLTPRGIEVGKKLILGHLIVELFLREYLGIKDDDITHNLACKLEHHIIGPIESGFRKQIGESAYQKLVHIVENDTDPEQTIKKIKEVFPSPAHVISQFSSVLVDALPDSKSTINGLKEKFLKSL